MKNGEKNCSHNSAQILVDNINVYAMVRKNKSNLYFHVFGTYKHTNPAASSIIRGEQKVENEEGHVESVMVKYGD